MQRQDCILIVDDNPTNVKIPGTILDETDVFVPGSMVVGAARITAV